MIALSCSRLQSPRDEVGNLPLRCDGTTSACAPRGWRPVMKLSLRSAALAALALCACGGTTANSVGPSDAAAADTSASTCEPLAFPPGASGPPSWAAGGCPEPDCPS